MLKENYSVFKQIINRHFHSQKIHITEYISEGRVNSIYRLKAENKEFIIKIQNFQEEECRQALGNEYFILQEYAPLLQLIPYVYYLDIEGNDFGKGYIILEYINGTTLENGNPNLFYLSGEALAKIHEYTSDYIGKIQNKITIHSNNDIEKYYYDYFSRTLLSLKKIDFSLANLVHQYVKDEFSINYYRNQKTVLLHNDVHLKNIIVNNKDVKYIDWDCSKYAHWELDFIKIRHLIENKEDRINLNYFMEGYRKVNKVKFTPNFKCHELIWLSKMIVFEQCNPIINHTYFPDILYYKNEIVKMCKKRETCHGTVD